MEQFRASVYDLIVATSTNLPPDVRRAIGQSLAGEIPGSQSRLALETIARNIDMACDKEGAICQDTGWPTFEIHTPVGANQIVMKRDIHAAISAATKAGKLRPNSVDSLTDENSGDNLGPGTPVIHWEQWENDAEIEIKLLLKGGGCENKNIQYSLPAEIPGLGRAGRDLDGVRKAILHAVWQAQGQGCSTGAIGVAIGGDRSAGYSFAKQQLFRPLDDVNPNPRLAELEQYIVGEGNKLGIGAMGFGGNATLIGCKVGALNRLPACFFVSVAYDCWAFRRLGVVLDAATGAIRRWLYRDAKPGESLRMMASTAGFHLSGKEVRIGSPASAEEILALRVGDVVLVSGVLVTGRDALHAYLMTHDSPIDLAGHILYHCGPVALQEGGRWTIKAAGPTTSIREEPYQADIIKKFGLRGVMGKGGMGPKTLAGLKECGAVYLNAIGGAAQFYADRIETVLGVEFLEFGVPEAMWRLKVRDFPAIVTMDAHGNSLHQEISGSSMKVLETFAPPVYTAS